MSRTIRAAEPEKYDSDKPERACEVYPAAMGSDHEDCMDKISSDPLLDMIAGSDAGENPPNDAFRKYMTEYLKKYRLLGTVECSNCGEVNYEGDQDCSQCGTSLVKKMKMKVSLR